jgi:hypothetical protein
MKYSQSSPMLSFSIALSATLFTTISPAATIGYYTFTTATALPAGGIVNIQAYSDQTALGLGSRVTFNQSYYDTASGKTPTIANGGALATSLTAALPAAGFNLATATTTPALPAAPAGSSRVGVISANALGTPDIAEVAAGSNAAAAKAGFNITLGGNVKKVNIAQNLIVLGIDSSNNADMVNPGQLVVAVNNGAPIVAALQGGDTPDQEAGLLMKALDAAGFVATDPDGGDAVDLDWNDPANSSLLGSVANITFGMQNSGAAYQLEMDFPDSAAVPEPAPGLMLGCGLALIGVSLLRRRTVRTTRTKMHLIC